MGGHLPSVHPRSSLRRTLAGCLSETRQSGWISIHCKSRPAVREIGLGKGVGLHNRGDGYGCFRHAYQPGALQDSCDLLIDFGIRFLARSSQNLVYLMLATGALLGLSLAVMILVPLYDIWIKLQ